MAYEPTNWQAGDVVTSAKLNKMEQGIASGANILVAHAMQEVVDNESSGEEASPTVLKLDKTAREILDADFTIVIIDIPESIMANTTQILFIAAIQVNPETEAYQFSILTYNQPFVAATEDDYPVMTLF